MLLELLQAVTGIFVVVYDGQHALKFTLGHAKGVVGPGVHFKVPIIQKFHVEETKHTTLDLEPQVIQLNDDLVYEVDCKVVYQIVNLRKAIVEIDELVTGLQNRVVIAVQSVIQAQDRESVRDTEAMVTRIVEELRPVEEQWGVRILKFGFSNISPSPASLEITQLELLAREKLGLYDRFRGRGLGSEAAVALVSGAVISLAPEERDPTRAERERLDTALAEEIAESDQHLLEEQEARREKSKAAGEGAGGDEDEEEAEDEED